jgi:lysine 2,3-aminomutase
MVNINKPIISGHIAMQMNKPAIARQYTPVDSSESVLEEKPFKGKIETGIRGTERMYDSEMIVFSSIECAARCTACIRRNYDSSDIFRMSDSEKLLEYLAREGISEVLITGGDPFMNSVHTLNLVQILSGTNLRHIRIGTAIFRADPKRISPNFIGELKRLNKYPGFIEVSPHFDHPADFTPKTEEKLREFNEAGIRLYVQTILLKGINDNPETFRELAEKIRDNGMEWHHFYHCVPVAGNLHLRTSVEKGFELIDSLENHEEVTGRHIPKRYTLASPIGKVYMDRSRIAEQDGQYLWIETRYIPKALNVNNMPNFCRLGKKGFLEVKYLDGKDN